MERLKEAAGREERALSHFSHPHFCRALKRPQRHRVATKAIGSRLLKTSSGNVSRKAQIAMNE